MLMRPSALLLVALFSTSGCLPRDTRPTPGKLSVTATADDALLEGIPATLTADGWSIVYERFLLGLGRVSLDGDSCNNYTDDNGYSRVIDVLRPGSQKVSDIYALGTCDFGFRIGHPSSRAALGAGVTEADKTFMRTPGIDAFVSGAHGISAFVQGRAEKDGVVKRFAWSIRQDFEFQGCRVEQGGVSDVGFALASGDEKRADITLRGEALFQDNVSDDEAKLRFDMFARADEQFGDGDGNVTLDELRNIPVGVYVAALGASDAGLDFDSGNSGWPALVDDSGVDGGGWKSLGHYVYFALVPRIARFRGIGSCTTHGTSGSGEF